MGLNIYPDGDCGYYSYKHINLYIGNKKHKILIPLTNPNETLLEILRNQGLNISAPCGGNGTCGKCVIETNNGKCLACKTPVSVNVTEVWIEKINNEFNIVDVYESKVKINPTRYKSLSKDKDKYEDEENGSNAYGIAIDIGTTTLVFELLEMSTGKRIATFSQINSQVTYGADVISRIDQATKGAQDKLHAHIIEDIQTGVNALLKYIKYSSKIKYVVIAGNTTMLHLLLNYPCNTLGVAPYTPVSLGMERLNFDYGTFKCPTLILPGISAFVGADIVSGLLCCGWSNVSGYNLLVDLGTNGEVALFSKNQILVASTAAGPAFEGGNISKGVGSVPGAISKANYNPQNGVFSYETIKKAAMPRGGLGAAPPLSDGNCGSNFLAKNNVNPIGICGSGVVDIVAQLVQHNLIDETGRFVNGADSIEIAPNITFTQRDIREFQLARSAICTGIKILTEGIPEINKVFLAGGFGMNLNSTSILFPFENVIPVGNVSLGGCSQVLINEEQEDTLQELTKIAKEIDLATHPQFNDLFMEYCSFNI